MNELDDWQFSANAYAAACQRPRSAREQQYPSYVIDMLDAARGGHDLFGRPMSREDADRLLAGYGVDRNHAPR